MARASVDLPEPDLAHDPKRLAAHDVEGDIRQGLHASPALGLVGLHQSGCADSRALPCRCGGAATGHGWPPSTGFQQEKLMTGADIGLGRRVDFAAREPMAAAGRKPAAGRRRDQVRRLARNDRQPHMAALSRRGTDCSKAWV